MNAAVDAPLGLIACPDCDLLNQEHEVAEGARGCCVRCGAVLFVNDPRALDRSIALTLATALSLVVANIFPIMIFSYAGRSQSNTLIDGVFWLSDGGLQIVALLVFLTSIIFPILRTAGLIFVLLPLRSSVVLPGARSVFRAVSAIEQWGMLDVYSLAILVTVVKLADLADATISTGCFALVASAVFMIATNSAIDRRDIWRRLVADA